MPTEQCREHDKCFENFSEKLDKLEGISAGIEDIKIRLEAGSGNFRMLEHRLMIVERILFAIIGTAGLLIVGALLRLIIKQ